MKFRTLLNYGEFEGSPAGSRYREQYCKKVDEEGQPTLVCVGKEDVYDSIQKASCGITVEDLIRRARAGDNTAIREPIDSYADISEMPSDLLSAHQMLTDAKTKYLNLPADVRSHFGNSFEGFLNAAVDGSLVKKLSQPNSNTVAPLSNDELVKIRNVIGGTTNA